MIGAINATQKPTENFTFRSSALNVAENGYEIE